MKKSTGSIDIVALARIAFSVTSSIDEDPYIRDCIVKQIKTNLPVSVAPLGYRLNQKEGSFSWITGQLKDDRMEIESWLGREIRKERSIAVLEENNIAFEMLPRKKYGQPLFLKYKGGVSQKKRPPKKAKKCLEPPGIVGFYLHLYLHLPTPF